MMAWHGMAATYKAPEDIKRFLERHPVQIELESHSGDWNMGAHRIMLCLNDYGPVVRAAEGGIVALSHANNPVGGSPVTMEVIPLDFIQELAIRELRDALTAILDGWGERGEDRRKVSIGNGMDDKPDGGY
jgi:hypothetical protein